MKLNTECIVDSVVNLLSQTLAPGLNALPPLSMKKSSDL